MTKQKKLRVAFTDFWPGADLERLFLVRVLRKMVDVELSSTPDLLIFSDFGVEHANYDCVKLHITYENIRPNFHVSDFAIGYDYNADPRYLRLPIYVDYQDDTFTIDLLESSWSGDALDRIIGEKTDFCCFLVSNPKGDLRNRFFEVLSGIRKVDSGGGFKNNIGEKVANKFDFIRKYKFNIAFENGQFPGYTTEKILQPHYVKTIPIYWGNPVVDREFDMRSCIWVRSEDDFERAIEEILEIDRNPSLHREMLSRSLFYDNRRPYYYSERRLESFLNKVLAKGKTEVSTSARRIIIGQQYAGSVLERVRHRIHKRTVNVEPQDVTK